MKKKFVMICVMVLFSLSMICGSVLLVCNNLNDLPSKERSGNYDNDTSGYWIDYCYLSDCQGIEDGLGQDPDNPILIYNAEDLAWLARRYYVENDLILHDEHPYLDEAEKPDELLNDGEIRWGSVSSDWPIRPLQGDIDDNYEVVSEDWFDYSCSWYVRLEANIDLSAHYWIPIGLTVPFVGHFDGNGYVISGMKCYIGERGEYVTNYAPGGEIAEDYTSWDCNSIAGSIIYMGLFGEIGIDAESSIKNLLLSNASVVCPSHGENWTENYANVRLTTAGLIAAECENVVIERCGVNGGRITYPIIENVDGSMIGKYGLLVGVMNSGTISQCFVQYAAIAPQRFSKETLWDLAAYSGDSFEALMPYANNDCFNSCFGGLVGYMNGCQMSDSYVSYACIAACFARVVGGLVGGAESSSIQRCYVNLDERIADIYGIYAYEYHYAGGLVGYLFESTISYSFLGRTPIYLQKGYNGYYDNWDHLEGLLIGSCAGEYVRLSIGPYIADAAVIAAFCDNCGLCPDFGAEGQPLINNSLFIGDEGVVPDGDSIIEYYDWDEPGSYDGIEIFDSGSWNLYVYDNYSDYDWEDIRNYDDFDWESIDCWNRISIINNGFPVLIWSIQDYGYITSNYSNNVYFTTSGRNSIVEFLDYDIDEDNPRYETIRASATTGYTFLGFYDGVGSRENLNTSESIVVKLSDVGNYVAYFSTSKKTTYHLYALNYTGNTISSIDSTTASWDVNYSNSGGIPSVFDNSRATSYGLTGSSNSISVFCHEDVIFTPALSRGNLIGFRMSSTELSVGGSLSYYSKSTTNYTHNSSSSGDRYLYAVYTTSSVSFNFAGSYVSENGTTYTNSTSSAPYGYISTSSADYYSGSQSFSTGTSITFIADAGDYYTFEGWYYNSSNSLSGATSLGTNTALTYTLSGSSPFIDKYVFAKFKRKTVSVTVEVMTATGTSYEQSTDGGTPTIKYYNSSNAQTTYTFSSSDTVTFTALAGKTLTVSTQGAKDGYVYMGITTRSTGPYNSTVNPTTSLTLGSGNETYYIYYVPNSAELKYDATEKYYYFEDGYMPQTYAEMIESGLNENITNNGTLAGTFSLENGTTYKLASYDDNYYLGFTATKDTTLDLVSYETSGTYSFTQGSLYWFRFEPIRWRITDYGTTSVPTEWNSIGAFKQNFTVVSDLVLWYDRMDANSNHQEDDEAYDMTFTSSLRSGKFATMLKAFATNYTSGKLQFSGLNSTEYQKYGSTGQQEIVVVDETHTSSSYSLTNAYNYTTGGTSSLRVASTDEISDTIGNMKAKSSCLVAFLMGATNENYSKYWTRDLDNLNAGKTVTDEGLVRAEWLTNSNGIRFAYTISEGMNMSIS